MLKLTQQETEGFYLVSSISEVDNFIVDYAKLLGSDITYNWVDYSSLVGVDYLLNSNNLTNNSFNNSTYPNIMESNEFADNTIIYSQNL